MPNRTTVNISLTPELDAFMHTRVRSGRYQSASEVVQEALLLLERHEKEQEDALLLLKTKLERGAAQAEAGELFDGDEVFEALRVMSAESNRCSKRPVLVETNVSSDFRG